jgi:two-component system chemotaxis sensor kinase CheA
LEKLINPLIIEGGDLHVDTDIYYGFARSLTHIFRNIIDHGIEPLEERLSRGKDEYGNIWCSVTALKDKILIVIGDDGQGINPDLIREKALANSFIDEESASKLSDSETINMIFREGFSTKDTAGEISGRGIGLCSVKSEVDKLGGCIEVKTKNGEGTEFHILLPYEDLTNMPVPSINKYMEPVINTTKVLFNEQTGLVLKNTNRNSFEKTESLQLKDVTAFININGVLDGTFIMSSDENLLQKIIQNFMSYNAVMYNLPEDESIFISEDILSEFFNTVLGNSIKMFTDTEDLIMIDTPVTISSSKNATLKYPGCVIWTSNLESSEGSLNITFMTSRSVCSDSNI